MVSNASDPAGRIQTVFYLFRIRYEIEAGEAGMRLAAESPDNRLCTQTIAELRRELAAPTQDLGMVEVGDSAVRDFLARLLSAYDEGMRKST